MTDLVLHALLHDQEPIIRLDSNIKRLAEMKSRGTEYFEINEHKLYIMYTVDYIRTKTSRA